MLNERALRTILVVLGLAIAGALLLAVFQWAAGNDTISLAVVGVMATLALAFAAVLTLEQNRLLVKAAAEEAAASREIVDEMRREREWAYKPLLVHRSRLHRSSAGRIHPDGAAPGRLHRPEHRNWPGPLPRAVRPFVHRQPAGAQVALGRRSRLASNAEEQVPIAYRRDPRPNSSRPDRYHCLVGDWQLAEGEEAVAVRYEDWFGTHDWSPGGPRVARPIEWRGQLGTMDQPDWLRCN